MELTTNGTGAAANMKVIVLDSSVSAERRSLMRVGPVTRGVSRPGCLAALRDPDTARMVYAGTASGGWASSSTIRPPLKKVEAGRDGAWA